MMDDADDGNRRERIGQGLIIEAAADRDPAPVIARLQAIGIDEEHVNELAGLIRRSGSLIFQRANPVGQKKRDAFLDAIRSAVAADAPTLDIAVLDDAIASIRIAECGYLLILAALERSAITKQDAHVRAAAAISLAEARMREVQDDIEKTIASGAPFLVPGGVMLKDELGRLISPAALTTSIVTALGGTLKMEGFGGKLFDKAGLLVLPALADVGDDILAMSQASEMLGMAWNRWETFNERARYLGQTITELESHNLPEAHPENMQRMFTREPEFDYLDWIANERSLDREAISVTDLMAKTDFHKRARGIDQPVAMSPAEWVAPDEPAQCLALSEAVGYEVAVDHERHGGLRLIHWVRGYCTLAVWARAVAGSDSRILRTTETELLDVLQRVALTLDEARLFLATVSFGRGSRDLFDTPVVRTETDWLVIGPAVLTQRLAKIIPSLLASRDIKLKRKGEAFETRVTAMFKNRGFDARAVTAWRNGAEYQYDALVPWGQHLLLIECKNRGLSNNDAAAGYHFTQSIGGDLKQVHRLAKALATWPEIVTDEFGADFAEPRVIPIVLQNETYALPGSQDGIYVYDWSALTRFLEEGTFAVARDHYIAAKNATVRNRVPIKRIWAGDSPTAEDFLAELENPHQLTMLANHMKIQASCYWLDEHSYVHDHALTRLPMTERSMAEVCGADADWVIAELDRKDAEIAKVREALETADD